MKTNKLEEYVTKRFKKMRILMNKSIKKFEKETIHKFRLEAKKIRALMRMLGIVDKKFNFKKQNKYIDSFYTKIGAVRDLQIQLDKYKQEDVQKESQFWQKYCRILRKDLDEKQDIILKSVSIKEITTLNKLEKNILRTIKNLTDEKLKSYFKNRVSKIQKCVDSLDFSPNDMHDLRKLIKEYNFNAKLLPKKAAQYKSNVTSRKKSWDDIQDILGSWYDSDNMIEDLNRRYSLMELTDGESDTFFQIKAQLEVEKALLRDEIKKIFDIHIY